METILITVSFAADLISGANLDEELAPAPTLSGFLGYIIILDMPFDELLGLRINGESRVFVLKGINIC